MRTILQGGPYCKEGVTLADTSPPPTQLTLHGACLVCSYHMWNFKGFNDAFFGNQCIFRQGYGSDCGVAAGPGWVVHDNSVYSQSGKLQVCGTDFAKWVAAGHDHGSSVAAWPTDSEIVAMGRKVLGM